MNSSGPVTATPQISADADILPYVEDEEDEEEEEEEGGAFSQTCPILSSPKY